jgi:hypothetical protein
MPQAYSLPIRDQFQQVVQRFADVFRMFMFISTAFLVAVEIAFLAAFQLFVFNLASATSIENALGYWFLDFVFIAVLNFLTDHLWLGDVLSISQKFTAALITSLFLPFALGMLDITQTSFGWSMVGVFAASWVLEYAAFWLVKPKTWKVKRS